jgi:hypothetical protein
VLVLKPSQVIPVDPSYPPSLWGSGRGDRDQSPLNTTLWLHGRRISAVPAESLSAANTTPSRLMVVTRAGVDQPAGQVGNRGLVVICSIEEFVGMHFLRRPSRCRTFGPSVAEGGARRWTFLERALFRAWERDLVMKTGSDLDTTAGKQVNVDRVWDRLQLSMTKGQRVCLHRFCRAGGRNHGVSTDQRRGVACVRRETSAVQCNYVTGIGDCVPREADPTGAC